MQRYAVDEIRLPLLEREGLYKRSTGETSDIVEKQMYSFADRDEAHTMIALRPEGTPGVVRPTSRPASINPTRATLLLHRPHVPPRAAAEGPLSPALPVRRGDFRPRRSGLRCRIADHDRRSPARAWVDARNPDQFAGMRPMPSRLPCRAAEFGRAHLAELCEDCHARLERIRFGCWTARSTRS